MTIPDAFAGGTVFVRGGPGYEDHAYQYATTSFEKGTMEPALIFYPKNDDDVIKAIRYAKDKNIAIAVRTGGHQYCGKSSTTGENIQIDLSETYKDFHWDDATGLLRAGISFALTDFNGMLGALGLFVPHGECSHVHVGGHMQSGGFGMLGRSFGLFVDHVESFEIITADCVKRTIVKKSADADDRELFYAVLAGSPGNFGIVTHVTIRPHRDRDHQKSRGMKFMVPLERNSLQRLLSLLAKWSDESDDLPGDLDFTVTVASAFQEILTPLHPDVDEQMKRHHPELYGLDKDFNVIPIPVILVFAQWANLGGDAQDYDPTFFERIKQAAGHIKLYLVSDDMPTPMSQLSRAWVWMNVREYVLPFEKRGYVSDSKSLANDGWAAWLTDEYMDIEFNINGCKRVSQLQFFGGKHSKMWTHPDRDLTAYSWRDARASYSYDIFYGEDTLLYSPRKIAQEYHKKADAQIVPGGNFCQRDLRWLWSSYGDTDMAKLWPAYYENEAKYKRLCDTKQRVDPQAIFTPNEFCVGGSPKNK